MTGPLLLFLLFSPPFPAPAGAPYLDVPALRQGIEPLIYRGEYQAARNAALEVADRAGERGDPRLQGWALDLAGTASFYLGELPAAVTSFETALALLGRAGDREGAAYARKDLGIARRDLGDYESALAALETARDEMRALGDAIGEGSATENLGMVYVALSLKREAAAAFDAARRLAESSGNDELRFGSLVREGLLLSSKGALPSFERALALATALHRPDLEAWARLLRSEALDELGRHEEAAVERRTMRAAPRSPEALLLRDEARLLLRGRDGRRPCEAHEGDTCPLASDPSGALDRFQRALALSGSSGTPLWSLRAGLGEARLALGDLPGAIDDLRAAAADIESVRSRLVETRHRESFFGRFPRVYELLQEALVLSGDEEAAFETSERSRARVLSESLRAPPPGPDLASRVRRSLPEDTAILSWTLGSDLSLVYVLTRRSLSAFRLAGEPAVVNARARTCADILARDGELPLSLLRPLSEDLLAPALRSLPASVRRLVVVPDGALNFLPVEVLLSPPSFRRVAEGFETSYAPSVSVLLALLERAPPQGQRADLLLLAAPDGIPGAPLSGSRREAAEVGRLAGPGSQVLVGASATSERLSALDLSRFRVLHLATHAVPDPRRPLEPALALTDGLFPAARVARLGGVSDLVVLSGCRTARGPLLPGEGVLSLSRAFFLAGARSVVASLWDVGDGATATFMASLYRHLARGESRGEAVRRARLESLARGVTSRDALGFILIGESRSPARVTGVTWYRRGASFVLLAAIAFGACALAVSRPRRRE